MQSVYLQRIMKKNAAKGYEKTNPNKPNFLKAQMTASRRCFKHTPMPTGILWIITAPAEKPLTVIEIRSQSLDSRFLILVEYRVSSIQYRVYLVYFAQYSGISSFTLASSSWSLIAVKRPCSSYWSMTQRASLCILILLILSSPFSPKNSLTQCTTPSVPLLSVIATRGGRASSFSVSKILYICSSRRSPSAWIPARVVLNDLPTNG